MNNGFLFRAGYHKRINKPHRGSNQEDTEREKGGILQQFTCRDSVHHTHGGIMCRIYALFWGAIHDTESDYNDRAHLSVFLICNGLIRQSKTGAPADR